MTQTLRPTLLSIGVAGLRHSTREFDLYTANSIREATAIARLMTFDLLLVGLANPTLDAWALVRQVRSAWPQQRWVLIERQITAEQEVIARSLGVLLILHELPETEWISSFAESLRRRDVYQPLCPVPSALNSSSFGLSVKSQPQAAY